MLYVTYYIFSPHASIVYGPIFFDYPSNASLASECETALTFWLGFDTPGVDAEINYAS